MEIEIKDRLRSVLGSSTLDFFYSADFGSENLESLLGWRTRLQTAIDEKINGRNVTYSIAHTKRFGGAALMDATEGQVGFDIEETSRVSRAVALRVSNEKQVAAAPTPAALFVAQEAAFKALRGPRQPKVVSEVEILEWSHVKNSVPVYTFNARLKGQQYQWFGVCFEQDEHTIGLCRFPHSSF